MLLIEEYFPLLLGVAPQRWNRQAVDEMAEAFEPHFRRGKKYAFVSLQLANTQSPGAHERKLVMDWLTSPRVLEHSKNLCVGAAAVMENTVLRGALTAVLWFWKPPFPLTCFSTVSAGVDFCVARLVEGKLLQAHDSAIVAERAKRSMNLARTTAV